MLRRTALALLLACGLTAALPVEPESLALASQVRSPCSYVVQTLVKPPATRTTEKCITAACPQAVAKDLSVAPTAAGLEITGLR